MDKLVNVLSLLGDFRAGAVPDSYAVNSGHNVYNESLVSKINDLVCNGTETIHEISYSCSESQEAWCIHFSVRHKDDKCLFIFESTHASKTVEALSAGLGEVKDGLYYGYFDTMADEGMLNGNAASFDRMKKGSLDDVVQALLVERLGQISEQNQ